MKTIALTGGGTAGHIMPNLALLPEFSRRFDRVIYLGAGGMEERLARENGIRFFQTEAVRLERAKLMKNVKIPFVLRRAVKEAEEILTRERVCCVFAKGGYVALPASLAAKRLSIPLVIHESDYSMGVANRLLSKFASGSITSFPETKGGVYIGNPIRDEIFSGSAQSVFEERASGAAPSVNGDRASGASPSVFGDRASGAAPSVFGDRAPLRKPALLVVGGSLGAEFFNRFVRQNLDALTERFFVLHVAGKGYDPALKHADYRSFPMTDRMPALYAAADVVLTRGGANTLAELSALGKRTLVVPLPKGASRGDQLENARSYEIRGRVRVLPQEQADDAILLGALTELLKRPPPKPEDRGETNRKIAEFVEAIVKAAQVTPPRARAK